MKTDVRYLEHESTNAFRNYPFSEVANMRDTSGEELATDVFVDASVYPVVGVDDDTLVRITQISCDGGVGTIIAACGELELHGDYTDGALELVDDYGRHAGTIVCGPGWERELKLGRVRDFEDLFLCPSATSPIVFDGVVGISDYDQTARTHRKNVVFRGDGCITPVLAKTALGMELSFDVVYSAKDDGKPVRRIIFATTGTSAINISDQGDGTVLLYMPELDREDVCWQANRDKVVSTVIDVCEAEQQTCDPVVVPARNEQVTVCVPPSGSLTLAADNLADYKNPLKVSTVEGSSVMRETTGADNSTMESFMASGVGLSNLVSTGGNGIRIGIPGV